MDDLKKVVSTLLQCLTRGPTHDTVRWLVIEPVGLKPVWIL